MDMYIAYLILIHFFSSQSNDYETQQKFVEYLHIFSNVTKVINGKHV